MTYNQLFGVSLLIYTILAIILTRLSNKASERIKEIAHQCQMAEPYESTERELQLLKWSTGTLVLGFYLGGIAVGYWGRWTELSFVMLSISIAVALVGAGWQSWTYWKMQRLLADQSAKRPVTIHFLSNLTMQMLGLALLILLLSGVN